MAQYRITQTTDIFAYEEITVSTTALSLTAATYKPTGHTRAGYALITCENAAIRFTMDGVTTPTSSVGHLLAAGSSVELESPNTISHFQAIRDGGSDALIQVSYGR